jgi:membrane protein
MAQEPDTRRRRRLLAQLRLLARHGRVGRFVKFVAVRFWDDQGLQLASGLSYISLLALVPMIAIGLAILAAFPAFDVAREQIRDLVQALFPPGSPIEVATYYDEFLSNASNLTVPGVIGLAFTAVLLLYTIDDVLSRIFREAEPRSIPLRILVYWAILTMGPLLFGASISISSYFFALTQIDPIDPTGFEQGEAVGGGPSGLLVLVSRSVAILLSAFGFTLIFFMVPHRPVRILHAFVGGLTAAMLLEVLKWGFGIYIELVRGYEVLYGALAAVPLFLLWLYLVWTVVLIGAETAASMPEWRYASATGPALRQPGDKLALALAVLERLKRSAEQGTRLTQMRLHRGLPATPTEIDLLLMQLRRAGLVDRTGRGRIVLARDLAHVTLHQLLTALKLEPHATRSWPGAADSATRGLAHQTESYTARSLADLLGEKTAAHRMIDATHPQDRAPEAAK